MKVALSLLIAFLASTALTAQVQLNDFFFNQIQLNGSITLSNAGTPGIGTGIHFQHYAWHTENNVLFLDLGVDLISQNNVQFKYIGVNDTSAPTLELSNVSMRMAQVSFSAGYKRKVYGDFGVEGLVGMQFGEAYFKGDYELDNGEIVSYDWYRESAVADWHFYLGMFYSFDVGNNRMPIGLGVYNDLGTRNTFLGLQTLPNSSSLYSIRLSVGLLFCSPEDREEGDFEPPFQAF